MMVLVAVMMLGDDDTCCDADGDDAGSNGDAIPALVVFAFIFWFYLFGTRTDGSYFCVSDAGKGKSAS